jgi:hypothetical protein
MPKYFFHIDGPKPYCDEVGAMLPDDRAAWNEARRTVRVIEHYLEPGQEWRIIVREQVCLFPDGFLATPIAGLAKSAPVNSSNVALA